MATPVLTPRARAIQRTARQSPYKMRLVIDQIRGKNVSDALALLRFSKKHAAKQIEKTLSSAVANAEYKARMTNEPLDLDALVVSHAVVNEGPPLKRFMPAAQGRATPIRKRTSHIDIVVAERPARPKPARKTAAKSATKTTARKATAKATAKTSANKTATQTEGEQ